MEEGNLYVDVSDARIIDQSESAVRLEFPTDRANPFRLWVPRKCFRFTLDQKKYLAYWLYAKNEVWRKYRWSS